MQVAGEDAGAWCAFGNPLDAPGDQRAEDGRSLSFTSAPLEDDLVILGHPEARLEVGVDRPSTLVVVRLCDVAPDGASTLLTARSPQPHPRREPRAPGASRAGEAFQRSRAPSVDRAGGPGWAPDQSRRLADVLPVGVAVTRGCDDDALSGSSYLDLPLRRSSPSDADLRGFERPETGPKIETEVVEHRPSEHSLTRDPLSGHVEARHVTPTSRERLPGGLVIGTGGSSVYEITEGDPLSVRYHVERSQTFEHDDGTPASSHATRSVGRREFHFSARITAYEGKDRFFEREWALTSREISSEPSRADGGSRP